MLFRSFYSKDQIFEAAFGKDDIGSSIVYFISIIGGMFTTLYSAKVILLTFLIKPNGPKVNYEPNHAAHEGNIYMSLPLIILAVFSIFFGYIAKDMYTGLGSDFFADNSVFIHPIHEILLDTEFSVPRFYKLLPLCFTISLIIIAITFIEFFHKLLIQFKLSNSGYNIFSFFNQRFLVEMYYNKSITGPILNLGGQTTKVMDKGSVEVFGPLGLQKNISKTSHSINKLNKGVVTIYALYILVSLIFYISILYCTQNNSTSYLFVLFVGLGLRYGASIKY